MSEELEISPLDEQFAQLMVRLNGADDDTLEEAARSVSAARGAGHICISLEAERAAALRQSRMVGTPGEFKPLILDASGRLYLQRYHAYETQLAAAIRERLGTTVECDEAVLQADLDRLFVPGSDAIQRSAAETAVRSRFCVITGGPGTGKTRTMALILALLAGQFSDRHARLALAAPTGKAAARMKEALARMLAEVPELAALLPQLPSEAYTLHRLLGSIPDSPFFRHNADHPLPVDVLLVDEASMIDLALMAKLFAALPPTARLILLGDKDQLSSVEAGNVLGDLCGPSENRSGALAQHIVELRTNYRFRDESGIHRLSQRINAGDADGAAALAETNELSDLVFQPGPPASALPAALREPLLNGYRGYLEAPTPMEALARLNQFRILCALRRGPYGVENLNRVAERVLADAGLITPHSLHYAGRPVLILANDYTQQLFNGDVGLILPDPETHGELRAFFLDSSNQLRRFLPARLPAHETTFAMTVHKSQGSEFRQVLLLLPNHDSPLLTRELIYTGVTRARDRVEVWSEKSTFNAAIARSTERTSGLRDALWK